MSHTRVLVVTPDFPPSAGGIQTLLGGLVAHAAGWTTLVLTIDHLAAERVGKLVPNGRVASGLLRQARIARLNADAVRRGLAWRPEAVISGHVVTSPAAVLLGELLGVPTVQYVHATELTHRPALSRLALARSTATIAHSQYGAGLARSAGAAPARINVITPGVAAPREFPGGVGKSEVPTILTVARLTDRYKGFDVMLRAMPLVRARVPAARWVMIGEGPLRGELERTARAWGLEGAVRFCGRVSAQELDGWYARSQVFSMLSRVPADGAGEGYGLVYLEAAVRGLPCVAGKAGAVAEAVIDGETGVLVDATDHCESACALIALLTDPTRAAALGIAARERAQTLSWRRMAATVEALVADLIGSRM